MSIDATNSIAAPSRAHYQQISGDFQSLKSDLQSGNIASAQADFAALLKDAPRLNAQLQSGAATPAASALSALATSLQSGNVGAAQTALTSLQQTMGGSQTMVATAGRHAHHHHHHHHQGTATATASTTNALAGGGTPNFQTLQSDFQALASSLQAGNLTGAQQALTQLQKDDPKLGDSGPAAA